MVGLSRLTLPVRGCVVAVETQWLTSFLILPIGSHADVDEANVDSVCRMLRENKTLTALVFCAFPFFSLSASTVAYGFFSTDLRPNSFKKRLQAALEDNFKLTKCKLYQVETDLIVQRNKVRW